MSRRQLDRPGGDAAGRGLSGDDSDCGVLHVDMDAFYASVELIDRPQLRGRPVIVGGGSTRGVVLSATYEARRFGIHSAMPMGRAVRMCPQAVVIPPDHRRYTEVSRGVMEIFSSITPLVEPLSLDEAFLDVRGARRRLGSAAQIAELIRARVEAEQSITCSVGVAATKFVAKLASGRAKPDGMLVVGASETIQFLHPLPIGALWGVGERTEDALRRLGLRTVADLAHTPVETLRRAIGDVAGTHLWELAWGRDPRPVVPTRADKSIGAEETFAHDVDDPSVVLRELLHLSEKVAARLRAAGMAGRTVSLKVRFADFTTITRARTLRDHTDVGQEVYATASELYAALGLDRARVRLVGVRVEGLAPVDAVARQLALDERDTGWREAEIAVDRAQARFGSAAVRPASLVRRADPRQRVSPPGGGRGQPRGEGGLKQPGPPVERLKDLARRPGSGPLGVSVGGCSPPARQDP